MSVIVLANADDTEAVFYCNTSEWAFGPLVRAHADGTVGATEMADAFLDFWADHSATDIRTVPTLALEVAYARWRCTVEPLFGDRPSVAEVERAAESPRARWGRRITHAVRP